MKCFCWVTIESESDLASENMAVKKRKEGGKKRKEGGKNLWKERWKISRKDFYKNGKMMKITKRKESTQKELQKKWRKTWKKESEDEKKKETRKD